MAESKFAEETEEMFADRFSEMIFSSVTGLAVAMGIETGLFQVMIATDTPRTSQEIADAGSFKERYVREWLSAMVTSHIVNYDPVKETYWLPAHRRCVTGSLASWSLLPPVLSNAFFPVAECFKKDGPSGVSYEVYPKFDHTLDKIHGPLFENTLLNDVLPSMPELLAKLESGIKVADVGCGPGSSTMALAKRFPKSQIYGLDQAEKPLIRARERAKSGGLTNAHFVCTDVATLPADWTGQFGYTFAHMIIHDLAKPSEVLTELLRISTPGGILSVFDPKLESDLRDNISHKSRNMAYGTSMFYTGKVFTMSEGTLTVRERDLMYRLMISQMLHDGYHDIASQLSRAVSAVPDCPPSNRLQHVVQLGLRAEPDRDTHMTVDSVAPGTGIDLEFDTDVQTLAPEAAHYETCYVTSHKAPCRVAAWSNDGQLVATGSDDASIKILDVERMLAKSATNLNIPESHGNVESHPVIRTLYDHIEDVTALDFHPTLPLLASGSKDFTIKFFDFSKSGVKRAFRSLQEAQEISCLNFHPGGNFLLVGTQHPTLRLYDITTLQCFVSSNPKDQHTGPITAVTYSPNATIYATASKDGSIKIWDGVSNRCVNTLDKAHSGTEVCSIQFSRNSKYLVSSGKDSLVKLWEVANSRTLITYTGASSEKQQHETRAVFNHTEDYVLFPDEKTTSLCCWDSRNAERNKLLSLGHNNIVRCIVHSPTGPGFMTCSDDFRARFWYYRPSSD